MLNFAAEIKWIAIMDIKKITHEEALRRWKHSLEIKREWERKVAERWANKISIGSRHTRLPSTMATLILPLILAQDIV